MSRPLDHFGLFGMAPRFAIDADALEAAFKQVQAKVHPDRFASATAAERRVAMQWATHANEAYRVLRSPVRRAAYLCELNGVPVGAESNTAMAPDFLVQQMHWRESLDDARGSTPALETLRAAVEAAREKALAALAEAIDVARDFASAAALVRQLMFIEKFHAELDHAEHAQAESLRPTGS